MIQRLAAFLFLVFLLSPSAVLAQNAPFRVDGFVYSLRSGSIHTFVCEVERCGRGAVVSFQYQSDTGPMTKKQFEEEKRSDYAALNISREEGAKLFVGEPVRRKIKYFDVLRISMSVRFPNRPPHYRTSGYIFGKSKKISLISSAQNQGAAKKNFDYFAVALAVTTDLGGQ